MFPQYSGVLETCLALRYWFLRCLAAKVLTKTLKNTDLSCFNTSRCVVNPAYKFYVKMLDLIIVGILTVMTRINLMLS